MRAHSVSTDRVKHIPQSSNSHCTEATHTHARAKKKHKQIAGQSTRTKSAYKHTTIRTRYNDVNFCLRPRHHNYPVTPSAHYHQPPSTHFETLLRCVWFGFVFCVCRLGICDGHNEILQSIKCATGCETECICKTYSKICFHPFHRKHFASSSNLVHL